MPWTFSHPAAVLPLKRLTPRYLSLPALMCGSLTPDFGYYFNPYNFADNAHTLAGSFYICIPTGLLLVLIFNLLREPLWFLLPQPHRSAIAPIVERPVSYGLRAWLIATVSVLIGAWTHIIWDSFTHPGTWFVRRIPLLRAPLLEIGPMTVYGHSILQHMSTLIGIVVMAAVYLRWLRSQPALQSSNATDGWRYLLIGAGAVVSGVTAVILAFRATYGENADLDQSLFVFKIAVDGACMFAAIIFAYCMLYYSRRNVTTSTSR